MANRRFEDFDVGREFQHGLGRSVLDADNTWFTLLNSVVVIEFERAVLIPKHKAADVAA